MERALDAYIREILDSPEYGAYARARDKVKQYPELKARIDEFRRRNFEMQRCEDAALERLEAFEREYGDFVDDPLVSEFLDAELTFCRMMQQNSNQIMEAICFE